jgi:hypothetical protein
VQEQDLLDDLPAAFFLQNVLQLHRTYSSGEYKCLYRVPPHSTIPLLLHSHLYLSTAYFRSRKKLETFQQSYALPQIGEHRKEKYSPFYW